MLGLVRLSLRRPYTAAIASLLILLMGGLALTRMIVDIFPAINIPVVLVVWDYGGLSAEDMERRVVLVSERAYSTTVNGIERIESQALPGIGLIKIYFQQGTDIGAAIAQITAVNMSALRIAPPGITPPNVIQYDASNVPVLQLTISSKTLPEQTLFDYSLNFIRLKLFTIPGLSIPAPFGGKQRRIVISVDPGRLSAKGFSANDVVTALQSSNIIIPAGTARIGGREYNVGLNSSPTVVDRFGALPLGVRGGVPVTLGDVARVSDSFANQTSVVHVNGQRATYMTILKHSDASTLTVVEATRDILPEIKAAAPDGFEINVDFDQSVFVRAAVENVVREAVISSILVSLMILLFLGSWRNTVIVSVSIPLSIFAGIAGLFLAGQTINLMTLGGLALAIGLLVDNATVAVENIHRNQALGKPLTVAILDGASEVVQPLTVATLAICIVFFPVVLLYGPARYLFIPLAITVVLAMLASYILSFSVVPALSRYMLAGSGHGQSTGMGARMGNAIDRGFGRFREGYGRVLELLLRRRAFVLICFGILLVLSVGLGRTIGTDFFPSADVGIIKLHYRGPPGTRLEDTETLVAAVENRIRSIIPAAELRTINDNIGVPLSYNLAFVPSDNASSADADILIELRTPHGPSADYQRAMRAELPGAFPGSQFYFQTADIVSQVLNFGLAAPIDVQISDSDFNRGYGTAQKLLQAMQRIPGVTDAHILQVLDYPALQVEVDRLRAALLGVSERDVANNLLTSLSSSQAVAPSFFLNPQNNVNYFVTVQMPLEQINNVDDLMRIAVSQPNLTPGPTLAFEQNAPVTRLADIASVRPRGSFESVNHFAVQRVIDVDANVDGRDLGGTARDIQAAIDQIKATLPSTTHIDIRGQNEVMNTSFRLLALGIVLAIVLVYALLVVLFQSWVDPFIIMMAVPGALIGILWMLALTHTTINVESLMGAIMSVGISVSNSILVVSFANELRSRDKLTPLEAAIASGKTRLRPVLMTALAMILGMVPMALGLGEAGEQNAPLGRAVIGGLVMATLTTLFVVPIFYTLLRRKPPSLYELDKRFEEEAAGRVPATDGAHG